MPEENFKNGKYYLDPRLDKYLRDRDIRLGGYRDAKIKVNKEVTKNLINLNYDYDFISKVTGLSILEIEEIVEDDEDDEDED